MKTFLALIGGFVICAMVVGAVVPDMNFHVVFADDEHAQKWHQRLAAELQTRIQEKQP